MLFECRVDDIFLIHQVQNDKFVAQRVEASLALASSSSAGCHFHGVSKTGKGVCQDIEPFICGIGGVVDIAVELQGEIRVVLVC